MGSELTPEALRLVEGLISGKGLAELAPRDGPARREILRHLESLLSEKKAARPSESKPRSSASASSPASKPRSSAKARSATTDSKSRGAHSKETAILFSDGASRGNPGPAAIGFIVTDLLGQELAAEGECIGNTTNNVAEYQALLAGLQKARELGINDLDIRLDSELVVRQLNGEYKVRHPALIEWKRRVDNLLGQFRSVDIAHVGREENAIADKLANEALDRQKRNS